MRNWLVASIAVLASAAVMAQTPPAAPAPGAQAPAGAGGQRGGGGRAQFAVTSTTWPDGGEVPLRHAGRGENKSPAFKFEWLGPGGTAATPPANLTTYAVVFHDMSVSSMRSTVDNLHWTLFNIPASATGLPEGIAPGDTLPDGSIQGPGFQRSRGQPAGYFGPAPPNGPFHHYVFEFYALDAKLDLPPTASRDELLKAMDGHVIGKSVVFGRFRPGP
jgi:Raf kinase inhibitor-like YbhB/YbcL family protein